MAYHLKTKRALRTNHVQSMGTYLGRLAIRKGFSVADISTHTGATRATVYNWFAGGTVSNAYRKPVADLIAHIKTQ